MNAVDILHNVEKYFDRNHNLFCMWGGLFALIFLGIFVPLNMVSRINSDMSAKLNAYAEQNSMLTAQVHDMSNQMQFLSLPYSEKQKILRDINCLAKNIYFEAGSEPRAGKIAVAEVTMNRVKSRKFPKTVCGVVYQKAKETCQFSWVCQENKVVRSQHTWQESVQIAENILIFNRKYGIIGSAKYFHADYVDPSWANNKVLVKQIGNHLFYN